MTVHGAKTAAVMVDDGKYKSMPTNNKDVVYVKKDNGSLPLDCPVVQRVVRHMDPDKGLLGHSVQLEIHLMGEVEVKIVRGKMFAVIVDGEEVARVKKKAS